MKKFTYSLILIIFGFVVAINARQGRILNGKNALNQRFPYLVAILIDSNFCGGSILNQRWILTAAHCLVGTKESSINVIAGSNNLLEKNKQIHQVESYIYHENYIREKDSERSPNDIGLIRLKEDIQYNKNVQPINLPTKNFDQYGVSGTFAGWGATKIVNGEKETTTDLQLIELKIIDQNECRRKWETTGYIISDSQLCTFTKVKEGLCTGDSGSPLVVKGVLVGIASYTFGCGEGLPDVFTRVYNYLDWIRDHIKK